MTIYQGYDLAALDIQYDIEATVDDLDSYRIEYDALSEKVLGSDEIQLDVVYGSAPLQQLDIFPAAKGPSPMVVYIHGGYWKVGDKAGYRFPAQAFNPVGVTWITMNYRLAPDVTLDDIVDDVRSAIAWIHHHAADFDSDPDRIIVAGSSAGGHLTGMIAAEGWQNDYGLPENVIKGIAAASGLYDLTPFLHTSQKEYLNLDDASVERNSPAQNLPRHDLPMLITWAGQETSEFIRQSQDYATLCSKTGNAVATLLHPEHNHFSLAREYATTESDLVQGVLKLIEGA